MIDTNDIIWNYDKTRGKKSSKETFYSGTTLENFRNCLIEDQEGNLYFEKKRELKHKKQDVYCTPEFSFATRFGIKRAIEIKNYPIILEGKLNSYEVVLHKLIGGKSFPVERVWILKKDSPTNFGERPDKIKNLQDYFESRNPLDFI